MSQNKGIKSQLSPTREPERRGHSPRISMLSNISEVTSNAKLKNSPDAIEDRTLATKVQETEMAIS